MRKKNKYKLAVLVVKLSLLQLNNSGIFVPQPDKGLIERTDTHAP